MDSLRSEAWIDGETLRVGLHHVDGPGLTVVSGPDLHMPRTDSNRFGCVVSGERTILCRDPQTLGRPGLPDPDTCEVRIVQPTLRWTASERVVGLAARVFSRDEPACWQLESGGVECASGAAHPGFERDVTPVPEQFGRLPSGVLCSLYTDGSVMCRDPSTQQVRVLTL